MGSVNKFEVEIVSSIPPKRLFKAFILDGDRLLPKLLPHHIKSIEIIEGDGRAGSVKLVTTVHDEVKKTSKQRVDEVDEEKLVFRYTVLKGDEIPVGVEKITNTVRFEAGPDGGSSVKNVVEYYYAEEGDSHKSSLEEKANLVKQKIEGVFKTVEAHLVAHPHEYAA